MFFKKRNPVNSELYRISFGEDYIISKYNRELQQLKGIPACFDNYIISKYNRELQLLSLAIVLALDYIISKYNRELQRLYTYRV